MNITKQQWTIIGIVVAIIAVWYFFLRKKKAESGYAANWLTNGEPNLESGYGPMGGSYSHFGDETNFGIPGSGYGLNEMSESGFRMAGRGSVGKCPQGQYPCGMSTASPGCCYETAAAGKMAGSSRVSGRVSGLTSSGISGTSEKSTGIAGTGVGVVGVGGGTAAGKITRWQDAPPCHRPCPKCSYDNEPCIGAGGYPVGSLD